MQKQNFEEISRIAYELRLDVIEMLYKAQSGHPGGSLSAAEILSLLYFEVMNIDSKNPNMPDRDRFILSKGHAAPILYAALQKKGYYSSQELNNLRQIKCMLQGHPCMHKTPGVDFSSGSLGHGLSIGCGMGLAAKKKGFDTTIYVLLGDGELNEGQNWEAMMAISKFKLDNVIAIVDYNKVQLDGTNEEIMPLEPLADKWKAFGWNTIKADGHCPESLYSALMEAKKSENAPAVVIADTIKGKGVSFMEGQSDWHGSPIGDDEYSKAMSELSASYKSMGGVI